MRGVPFFDGFVYGFAFRLTAWFIGWAVPGQELSHGCWVSWLADEPVSGLKGWVNGAWVEPMIYSLNGPNILRNIIVWTIPFLSETHIVQKSLYRYATSFTSMFVKIESVCSWCYSPKPDPGGERGCWRMHRYAIGWLVLTYLMILAQARARILFDFGAASRHLQTCKLQR